MRVSDGDGMNRQAGVCAFAPLEWQKTPQVKNRFFKPICKPDVVGQAETRETHKSRHDFMPSVCQGQHGDHRLPETAETRVV